METQKGVLKRFFGTGKWDTCRVISSERDEERHGRAGYDDEIPRSQREGWIKQVTCLCWHGVHFVVYYHSAEAIKPCDGSCGAARIENFLEFYPTIKTMIAYARKEAEKRLDLPPRISLTKLRTPAEGLLYEPVRLSFAGDLTALQKAPADPIEGWKPGFLSTLGIALITIIVLQALHLEPVSYILQTLREFVR